jgi:hypothetical protein
MIISVAPGGGYVLDTETSIERRPRDEFKKR